MPKKYGVKEKDEVVAHIVDSLLTGKLRTGDRLHRKDVAEELGLSRAPVQEAVVQLEHDGVLTTRYHRGVFVERFDEHVLMEHFEVYGALTAIAAARAATTGSTELLTELGEHLHGLRSSVGTKPFHQHAVHYRQAVLDAHAGPRLRAAIRAATNFAPRPGWPHYLDGHPEMLATYDVETSAIETRDAESAHAACLQRAEIVGRIVVHELVRRRVLGPAAAVEGAPVEP